jgi:acyl dehydratase
MGDPEIVGKTFESVRFPVDRSKIAELARSFQEEDNLWYDDDAAKAAGFDAPPTQPTVTALVDHWREGGALANAEAMGLNLARVLHGEAAWEYILPVRVGDTLTSTATVTDVSKREGKRGGSMTFVTIETEFRNQRGELAARRRDVVIETGGAS